MSVSQISLEIAVEVIKWRYMFKLLMGG